MKFCEGTVYARTLDSHALYGSLQFVDVCELVEPQSLATARRRSETWVLTLAAEDLKYVSSLVPALAAEEAAEASFWQFCNAVRIA